ncbi:MAG: hypothetical protein GY841_04640 [FCB group bacterium]|nr:hypothetical protein [FCB group bacterium]
MKTPAFAVLTLLLFICPELFAQGSIFGTVTNADASVPDSGVFSFFGYLDDTDEEISIESSIGAGYNEGNWYDDFQNYLTEAPGNPYDYHFYNPTNGEGYILSDLIPNNSFQQEDINLSAVDWPDAPTGLTGTAGSDTVQVMLEWDQVIDLTYHIYRRGASSNGSFFRIDDTNGSLLNPGVDGGAFTDTTVDGINEYQYLLIAEDLSGQLSPHSEIITVNSSGEISLCGDANGDEAVNIGDPVYLINYIFKSGAAPVPLCIGDANGDDAVNIGDPVYIINYIFKSGPPPIDPCCP